MFPSNKVSEFLRKSNNQDGGKNKKDDEVVTAWKDRKIYFDACKNVYHTDVFEVVAKARRKCYHLTVGCPFGRIKGA